MSDKPRVPGDAPITSPSGRFIGEPWLRFLNAVVQYIDDLPAQIHQRGLLADQPDPTTVLAGTLYAITDTTPPRIERSDGTVWESFGAL